jgi:hypothetical protein
MFRSLPPFNQSPFTIRYSPFAAVLLVANRQSPFAAVEPKFLARFQNCFT